MIWIGIICFIYFPGTSSKILCIEYIYWEKTTARWVEKHLSFGIRCHLYWRFDGALPIFERHRIASYGTNWSTTWWWTRAMAGLLLHKYRSTDVWSAWRNQMETFSAFLALSEGNRHWWFPPQRPVTRTFDVFFDLSLNKRLSKQLWRRWFKMPSLLLWRQCNGLRNRD